MVKKLLKIWSWDPGSEIRDPEKTYSGSRIQGSKRHRIPDPDTQHCRIYGYIGCDPDPFYQTCDIIVLLYENQSRGQEVNPNPDTDLDPIRIQGFYSQNTADNFFYILLIKNCYLFKSKLQEKPSTLKKEDSAI